MAIKGYFFNAVQDGGGNYDRVYNAEDVTGYLDGVVGSGVFPTPSTNLQVSSAGGMDITVAVGMGWINGYKLVNTAALTFSISASDVLLNRIDNVVFYVDYVNRVMGIDIVEGTPASTAVAPSLTRNSSRYEMCLAQISVAKQITAISNAMITDTRSDSDICGWVAGLVQTVDTSTLFQQYQAAYEQATEDVENWESDMETAFEAWFDTLTQQLNVNTYIEEYKKTVTLSTGSTTVIDLDMTGYTWTNGDIIKVYINGLLGVENTDYTVYTGSNPTVTPVATAIGTVVDVVVFKSKIGFTI